MLFFFIFQIYDGGKKCYIFAKDDTRIVSCDKKNENASIGKEQSIVIDCVPTGAHAHNI